MILITLKQALEALESRDGTLFDDELAAITALRQAIEQAEQQEPVAWLHPANATCVTTDPTAYARGIPLYTAPPQRKPLTDEEIVKMAEANLHAFSQYIDGGEAHYEGEIDFARAIEAAHGIKENT
jgi:hypothetical protein